MSKSQADALTLLGVLIAGAFVGRLWPAAGGWTVAIAGLVLLTILFAYDREGDRTLWQSIAFGAVCGFCLVHVCFPLLLRLRVTQPGWTFYTPNGVGTPVAEGAPLDWPAMIWLAGGVIFTIVDRARMSARQVPPSRAMFQPAPVQRATPAPEPARSEPTVAREPEFTAATPNPPVVTQAVTPATPTLVNPPSPAPTPAPAPPPKAVPLPVGSGKPATIYLNLIGEGMTLLRSVKAEHLGKDYYRIVEPVPPGETWEFTTGQIVRCQKKTLSSGKALVAFEEAPRAS